MIHTIACPVCSEWNLSLDNFCMSCGAPLRRSAAASQEGNGEVPAPDEASGPTKLFESRSRDIRGQIAHTIAYRSDIGLMHHTNQDAGGAWTWSRGGVPASLIAVADGVSAGRKSEEASSLVIDMLRNRMAPLLVDEARTVDDIVQVLLAVSREANGEVAKRPHHSLSSADATTLVAAFCIGNEGAGVWCGDSRVYQLAPFRVARLTRDHSWAEQVVHHGLMSAEEAARDPRAHMITRWLGPPVQEDPGLESFRFRLAPGEAVMCCTDGLYGYFGAPATRGEEEMAEVLFAYGNDIQLGVDELVRRALERGGRDNITAAVILSESLGENETVYLGGASGSRRDQQSLHLKYGHD